MVSNADSFRVAVAICALRFKPSNQSCAFHGPSAYVLDLRSIFPPSNPNNTTDPSWRDFALSLERDYVSLQAKYETEQIKSLSLKNAAHSMQIDVSSSVSEPTPASKKKAKKKASGSDNLPQRSNHSLNLKSVVEGLQSQSGFNDILTSSRTNPLFSALNDCLKLCSLPLPRPDLVLSAILRVTEAASLILDGIVIRLTPSLARDPKLLETLGLVLYTTLAAALPLLVSRSPEAQPSLGYNVSEPSVAERVIHLFERVATLVLNRLITTFAPISVLYMDGLFASRSGSARSTTNATSLTSAETLKRSRDTSFRAKSSPIDIRKEMCSLFRTVFHLLDTHSQSKSTVPGLFFTLRASLILETVRALEELLSQAPSRGQPSNPGVDATERGEPSSEISRRVRRLATKDTLWYLCSILHTLCGDFTVVTLSDFHSTTKPGSEGQEEKRTQCNTKRRQHTKDAAIFLTDDDQLLREAVSHSVFRLVTRCKRTALTSVLQPNQISRETRVASSDQGDRWEGRDGQGTDRSESGPHGDPRVTDERGSSSPTTSSPFEGGQGWPDNDKRFELDNATYGMLLGAIERYWHWSQLLDCQDQ